MRIGDEEGERSGLPSYDAILIVKTVHSNVEAFQRGMAVSEDCREGSLLICCRHHRMRVHNVTSLIR